MKVNQKITRPGEIDGSAPRASPRNALPCPFSIIDDQKRDS